MIKKEYIEEDEDGELFYEIYCRSPQKCGSFVSSTDIKRCPKCKSQKTLRRIVKKKLDFPK